MEIGLFASRFINIMFFIDCFGDCFIDCLFLFVYSWVFFHRTLCCQRSAQYRLYRNSNGDGCVWISADGTVGGTGDFSSDLATCPPPSYFHHLSWNMQTSLQKRCFQYLSPCSAARPRPSKVTARDESPSLRLSLEPLLGGLRVEKEH